MNELPLAAIVVIVGLLIFIIALAVRNYHLQEQLGIANRVIIDNRRDIEVANLTIKELLAKTPELDEAGSNWKRLYYDVTQESFENLFNKVLFDKRLTQSAVAKKAGISQPILSQWLSSRNVMGTKGKGVQQAGLGNLNSLLNAIGYKLAIVKLHTFAYLKPQEHEE